MPIKWMIRLPLLDPYAKAVSAKQPYAPLGIIAPASPFDWGNDKHLEIPLSDLIIYEMHVSGFTMHSSSRVKKSRHVFRSDRENSPLART